MFLVRRSRGHVRSDEKETLMVAHALIESKYEKEWADYREALPEIAAFGHTEEELRLMWLADNARRLSREADPARAAHWKPQEASSGTVGAVLELPAAIEGGVFPGPTPKRQCSSNRNIDHVSGLGD